MKLQAVTSQWSPALPTVTSRWQRFFHTNSEGTVFVELPGMYVSVLSGSNASGGFERVVIPKESLTPVIRRNAMDFAHVVFSASPIFSEDMPLEEFEAFLDPTVSGPEACVAALDRLVEGEYSKVSFDVPQWMGAWGRYFGESGYAALELLLQNMKGERHPKRKARNDDLEKLSEELRQGIIISRCCEGDADRYFKSVFGISEEDSEDISVVFEKMRSRLPELRKNPERMIVIEELARKIGTNQEFDEIKINAPFLQRKGRIETGAVFLMIETSESEEEFLRAFTDERIRKWTCRPLSDTERSAVAEIMRTPMESLPELMEKFGSYAIEEQSNAYLAIAEIFDGKNVPGLAEKLLSDCFSSNTLPSMECLAECVNDIGFEKTVLRTLKGVPVSGFGELFDRVKTEAAKKRLLSECPRQMAEITKQIREGNVLPNVRILNFVTSRRKSPDPVAAFLGISEISSHGHKRLGNDVMPVLPGRRTENVLESAKSAVSRLLLGSWLGMEEHVGRLIRNGAVTKNSLLYDFDRNFFPIGGKVHFPAPLDPEKTELIRSVCGFAATPFKLLHADTSLCLPPCQSPAQLVAVLYRLSEMGIISDDALELQLSVAGRVPNELAGIMGSACVFLKNRGVEYPKSAFVTSHNDQTGTCIMCYDAGVLNREWFPNIPSSAYGRTDMLGFKRIEEVVSYFLVGNLVSQRTHGGNLSELGKAFIRDYRSVLKKYRMEDILEEKWVHDPERAGTPAEEISHYEVVKRCTDALRDDMRAYGRDGDTDGISFETKDLLYRYVTEYRLLPLDTEWARRYLSFLSYRESVRALQLRK